MRLALPLASMLFLLLGFSLPVNGQSVDAVYERSGVQGGLVVQLGYVDADVAAQLARPRAVTVQILDVDPQRVAQARQELETRGLYGKVTVDEFDGARLPYANDLVNLIVLSGPICDVPDDELLRALCPSGTAMSLHASDSNRHPLTKPWPDEIDQWTHFLHDASGNAVAADRRVGHANSLQWIVEPKYCRSHEIDSSLPAMVSAQGRLFYFLDEGPIGITDPRFPSRWMLVARDAFNGVLLWKQPLKSWGWQQWKPEIADADWRTLRGQRGKFPAEVSRRLVAVGDRVYVTLGFYDAPLSILDAATGRLVKTCEGTDGVREIVVDNGTVFARVQPNAVVDAARRGETASTRLVAIDAVTGQIQWAQELKNLRALSLVAARDRVICQQGVKLACYDQGTGELQWEQDCPQAGSIVIHKDVVLTNGKGGAQAFSMLDGTPLWKGPNTGRDLLVIDDLVWSVKGTPGILQTRSEHWPTLSRQAGAALSGYDYRTGDLRRTIDIENAMSPGHHLRCYQSKATERFILYPKRGAEFLDLHGDQHMRHDWLRGSCRYGILPCNGLLYTPPDQCFCYIGAKMDGLMATSSVDTTESLDPLAAERLTKGPAYGAIHSKPAAAADWPAFRADSRRSGANREVEVSQGLTARWEVSLEGKLTQPTVADGKVFVAAVESHTVHALQVADGSSLWKFTAGGRIDSSPTYFDGSLLFGANDGCVYCLDAADGRLAWKFQAAPSGRRLVAFGQVESPWPVHGSVLMLDSLAYVAAGRSTLVDGGAYFYALDPGTGKVVHHKHVFHSQPDLSKDIGDHFAMDGSNIDVLTTDGEHIFCTQEMFDARLNHIQTPWNTRHGDRFMGKDHLMATGGILDDTGFNRIYWSYGNRWPGFYFMLMAPKSGNLLVFDDQHTWATKWFVERNIHSGLFFPETTGYLLFCDDNAARPFLVGDKDAPEPIQWLPTVPMQPYHYDSRTITDQYDDYSVEVDKGAGFTRSTPAKWQEYLPIRIEAMALTRDTLFAAGSPDVLKSDDPLAALEGRLGGVLAVIDPTTGETLSKVTLSGAPSFDGMSAANGSLYLVTRDGRVIAWK